jgi:capsular exopolysaccharide synthesis family protein
VELRDYLRVVRARKWVIVQAVFIVTLAALVASLVQPRSYQSEAKVLISEQNTGAAIFGTVLSDFSNQPDRALQTQVQLVRLRPLAEDTIRKLNLQTTPDELLAQVDVSAVGQTNLISVKAADGNAKRAADIANSIAQGYVDWSMQTKRESIKAAADEVEARLNTAQGQILELGRKISAQGKTDELSAELQIATGAYTILAQRLEELRVNEQLEIGSGRVVSPAVVDEAAVSPKPARNTGLGLAVGLIFGLGMAFLYEYLDNTIKSDEEVEKLYGVPVLGHIPFVKLDKGQKHTLTIVEKPGSAAAESYRVLRNSLDFINFEQNMKTLMVTSSAPGEGKSTIASNLAASLAQAGSKVVMVSCDFRRPTTEGFFGVPNVIGLSDVLLGKNSLKAALQRPGDEELLVLTSGKMPPNPSELLGSSKMQELVENLEEWADWIIIDTPPLLAVSDGAAVARWADGVMIVSRAGLSTRDTAKQGSEMLGNVGAKLIGVVVTAYEESQRSGSGYYGSSHYYTHYHGYYSYGPKEGQRRSDKEAKADSGAQAPVSVKAAPQTEDGEWVPIESPGRRLARAVGRILTAVLVFLLVIAIAALLTYFLDQHFGWGVVGRLIQLWR